MALLIDTLKTVRYYTDDIESSETEIDSDTTVDDSCNSPFKPVNKDAILREDNVLVYRNDYKKDLDFFRKSKNKSIRNDAIQQSFLIHELIKNGFKITISRIYKTGSFPSFRIKKIEKDGKSLLTEADLDFDILDKKRRRRCIDAKTNNEMIRMLQDINYIFEFKKNKKCKTINLVYNDEIRRIKSITINKKPFPKQDFVQIGERTHNYIYDKVKKIDCCFDTILI